MFIFICFFFCLPENTILVPNNLKDIENGKFLLRGDIENKEEMLIVTMKWSKTNHFGQRLLQIPLIGVPNSNLCPMTAYKSMCKVISAKKFRPLICSSL